MMTTMAEQAVRQINDANRARDLEQQVLVWDDISRLITRVVERGVDEFADGSFLIEDELVALPDQQAFDEWRTKR
jgi:hypothetical protein